MILNISKGNVKNWQECLSSLRPDGMSSDE